MHGVNVPFRTPQRKTDAIKRALARYCENYLKTIKKVSLDGAYRLRYTDKIDYSFLDDVKI